MPLVAFTSLFAFAESIGCPWLVPNFNGKESGVSPLRERIVNVLRYFLNAFSSYASIEYCHIYLWYLLRGSFFFFLDILIWIVDRLPNIECLETVE